MINYIARLSSVVILLATLASASILPPQKGDIAVTIPFPFLVGTQAMQAGEYLIRLDPASGQVEICEDGVYCETIRTVAVETGEQGEQPRIVFRRHGSQYSFALLWSAEGTGHRVMQSVGPLLSGDSDPDYELIYVEARPLSIHRHQGLGLPPAWR